ASTPCFTTSPPSPKTPSRPPSRPTSPSQSPHGRHTSRKKPPTSWASVPSNTPIQLDLIKLEQWVAKVERGKLRLGRRSGWPRRSCDRRNDTAGNRRSWPLGSHGGLGRRSGWPRRSRGVSQPKDDDEVGAADRVADHARL